MRRDGLVEELIAARCRDRGGWSHPPPTYGSDPSVSVNGDVTVPDGGRRDKAIPTSLQPHHGRAGSSVGGDRGWPEFEMDAFDVVAQQLIPLVPGGANHLEAPSGGL